MPDSEFYIKLRNISGIICILSVVIIAIIFCFNLSNMGMVAFIFGVITVICSLIFMVANGLKDPPKNKPSNKTDIKSIDIGKLDANDSSDFDSLLEIAKNETNSKRALDALEKIYEKEKNEPTGFMTFAVIACKTPVEVVGMTCIAMINDRESLEFIMDNAENPKIRSGAFEKLSGQ